MFDGRGRRSTTPTSPSLSPSTSVEELTAVSIRAVHTLITK